MDNTLRNQCKLLKALQNVSYKEMSEHIGIKQDSFYSWIRGNYDLSVEKKLLLKELLNSLKEY